MSPRAGRMYAKRDSAYRRPPTAGRGSACASGPSRTRRASGAPPRTNTAGDTGALQLATAGPPVSDEQRDGIQVLLSGRAIEPAQSRRNLVEAAGSEAGPEVSEPRDEDLDDRQLDVGARLIQHQQLEAQSLQLRLAGSDVFQEVVRPLPRKAGRGA